MFKQAKLGLIVLAVMLVAVVAPTFALTIQVSGVLHGADNPTDEYPIYIEAGERISIHQTCSNSELDTRFHVYGPNGYFNGDDDSGVHECGNFHSSKLGFVAPTTGVYTIIAGSFLSNAFPESAPEHLMQSSGAYSLEISGNFTPLFDYNPDGRLNHGYGDLYAVLFAVQDAEGNPAIDVYCFTGESWTVTLQVTAGSSNASAAACAVDVFVLEDGRYQFNITTDGKLYTIICADLTCEGRESSYFDPNE